MRGSGLREEEQWSSKMSTSPNLSHSKIRRIRGSSSGWAAFDLKQQQQQQKQGLEYDADHYPPVSSTRNSAFPIEGLVAGNSSLEKSFASVARPSLNSPVIVNRCNHIGEQMGVIDSSSLSRDFSSEVEKKDIFITHVHNLKELHKWADDCLIEDILGAVNNDFFKASTLLQQMVPFSRSEETKITNLAENRSPGNCLFQHKTSEGISEVNKKNADELSFALEECLPDLKKGDIGEGIIETKVSESTAPMKLISKNFISVPMEPEWEEDDVYLCHRRDAIRATRSAAQHSRAASNAFLRGDHYSAQQLSLKAQQDWMAAQKLNSEAAQEILSIRNSANDVWKLDLHGLHSSEAVHALQDHLWKIETHLSLIRPIPSNSMARLKSSSPVKSGGFLCVETKPDNEQTVPLQKPATLQVITGTGNHSRGQASLPGAVRSFLIENGYRFDETRPGVIAVRPKFRNS